MISNPAFSSQTIRQDTSGWSFNYLILNSIFFCLLYLETFSPLCTFLLNPFLCPCHDDVFHHHLFYFYYRHYDLYDFCYNFCLHDLCKICFYFCHLFLCNSYLFYFEICFCFSFLSPCYPSYYHPRFLPPPQVLLSPWFLHLLGILLLLWVLLSLQSQELPSSKAVSVAEGLYFQQSF